MVYCHSQNSFIGLQSMLILFFKVVDASRFHGYYHKTVSRVYSLSVRISEILLIWKLRTNLNLKGNFLIVLCLYQLSKCKKVNSKFQFSQSLYIVQIAYKKGDISLFWGSCGQFLAQPMSNLCWQSSQANLSFWLWVNFTRLEWFLLLVPREHEDKTWISKMGSIDHRQHP